MGINYISSVGRKNIKHIHVIMMNNTKSVRWTLVTGKISQDLMFFFKVGHKTFRCVYRIVTVIYVVIYYGAKYQNLCHWEQTKKTDIGRLREANLFSAKI
jgi:hypothetical protein